MVIKRFLGLIPNVLLWTSLTFFLIRLAPGGPFDTEQVWPPEIQANIAEKYELHLPVLTQYLHWLRNLTRGDLRESFQYLGRPVLELIGETLPVSMLLGGAALVLSLFLGLFLGCLSAWNPGGFMDRFIVVFCISGLSIPSYLVASGLILFFSLYLDWLPPALWETPSSCILPICTLVWRPLGLVARLTRTSILEALSSDYIRTARAKGLSEIRILFKHALRNALAPCISLTGPLTANLLTGSFLVETVFQIPGMGKYFVQAVLNRDYPLIMGVTLVFGLILSFSNLISDLILAWVDPRVKI